MNLTAGRESHSLGQQKESKCLLLMIAEHDMSSSKASTFLSDISDIYSNSL